MSKLLADKNILNSTAKRDRFDVVIVGGSMVGITLALMLAKRKKASELPANLKIALIETADLKVSSKKRPVSFDDRSLVLSWRTRQMLHHLDLWQSLAPQVEPITKVHVSEKGSFGSTVFKATDHDLPALGYVVYSRVLGEVLFDHLHQNKLIKTFSPANVMSIQLSQSASTVEFDLNGKIKKIKAGLVVLSDGGQSQLSETLGITKQKYDYDHSAIVTSVATSEPHNQVAYERFTDEGPMALLPQKNNLLGLVWTMPNTLVRARMEMNPDAFCSLLNQRFGFRLGSFTQIGERLCYPLIQSIAREQVFPGVVLVGSSAHHLHPVAGQGFNLCVRDLEVLTQLLTKAYEDNIPLGSMHVLQKYAKLQASDQMLTTALSHGLARWFISKQDTFIGKTLTYARALGLLVLGANQQVKSSLLKGMMQI